MFWPEDWCIAKEAKERREQLIRFQLAEQEEARETED